VGLMKSKGRSVTARDRVRPYTESASQRVAPMAGQVRDHLAPAMGTARERMTPYAEKAVERGAVAAHLAAEKVSPVIDEALGKVTPVAELAAEKARERLNDDVVPKVAAALAALAAAAEPAVMETTRRTRATRAALRGELDLPPAKKSHKVRSLVLFLGFGAILAAVARKLLTPPQPAWQSTPTSGRDYSSSPTATTSPRQTADTEPAPATTGMVGGTADLGTGQPADAAASPEPVDELKGQDDTVTQPSSNGATKKAPPNTQGPNDSKPAGES
jgi:hypothetical protein